MGSRQVFSAFLLLIILIILLYPTTATGTVSVAASYAQAPPIETPLGPIIITGVTNLYVSFSEIRIHLANERNDSGWIPIIYNTASVDIIRFSNNPGVIFSTPTVPVGEYDRVFLRFGNSSAVVNGTTLNVESIPRFIIVDYRFSVKSGSETALKLKFTADYRAINISKPKVFFEISPMQD
ncbi:MAG: DUF4382 domain-containing protein [Candidatus Bathyarchaeia archaeon]|nr:DUF4382 domain-containing protein [Candidatus Bathyarchaeota archaeon]